MDQRKTICTLSDENEFIALLNEAKKKLFGKSFIPFSRQQLIYYSKNKSIIRYKEFLIPKKNGSTRKIKAPIKGLKTIQKCINLLLQQVYEPHPGVTGFLPNLSIVSNAGIHLSQKYLYNIDLKDFFTSISSGRVYSTLQKPPFCIHNNISSIITDICCEGGCLPQGAPTSPILSNIICSRLDIRLMSLANKYKIKYSRYADDITFSSNKNLFHKDGHFIIMLEHIIKEEGFSINQRKTRLQKYYQSQKVTGLLVNQKTNVDKSFIKQLRTLLHNWEVFGYEKAQIIFLSHYIPKKHINCEHYIENVIEGKLNFIKMVKGSGDITYLNLKKRYNKLLQSDHALLSHNRFDSISSKTTMKKYETNSSSVAFKNALLENVTNKTVESSIKWIVNAKFAFPIEAKNMVKSMSVIESNFGNSIQFTLFDNKYCFIPCDNNFPYSIGDKPSWDSIGITILSKKERKDIIRVSVLPISDGDERLWKHNNCQGDETEAQDYIKEFSDLKRAYDKGDINALDRINQLNKKLNTTILSDREWSIIEIRSFTPEEIGEVKQAFVCESIFGKSCCFILWNGETHYIPMDIGTNISIGDPIEMNEAILVTYGRKNATSIYRLSLLSAP